MKTLVIAFIVTTQVLARGPIPAYEDLTTIAEGQRLVTSLSEVAYRGLLSAKTSIDLWSGPYWPYYQGSLGVRYRDPQFFALISEDEQYNKFRDLYEKLPLYTYSGKENLLSPAEKYDLLVEDPEMTLTKYSWELGEKVAIAGRVKTWRGLCDGWASAAQKMPRPRSSVTLAAPGGAILTFYPEDLKALGSLMYGRSQKPVAFLGKRCRNQIQGLFSGACAETNPGTFHLALINRVGNLKKSFVADIAPGGEVWNYPVESYNITYYNVFDRRESLNFETVKELFLKPKQFSKHHRRHKNTHSIVGVKLEVNFRDMRPTNLHLTDGPSMDLTLKKIYTYDLELDVASNVLGGESHSKNLPDFIWAPTDGAYPLSDAEENNYTRPLPDLAQESSRKGQPLAQVIKRLFELSK